MVTLKKNNTVQKTTLISVIGRPRKGNYDHAIYELNGRLYETDFFFIPLLHHYKPQQFYLLGTQDSIWEQVEKTREKVPLDYEKIIIPFGIDSQEIWQIFETIVQLPLRNTRLVIDITHGFRAIPFAVFLAAVYFQAVREDVQIEDVLYGNYEARDRKTEVAPVVHLRSYLDMNEWIRAARRFVQYGDGDLLLDKLSAQGLGTDGWKLLEAFKEFIGNLQLNFVTQIAPSAERVSNLFTGKVYRELHNISPYALLHPLLEKRLNLFLGSDPQWQRQWRIANWFYSNRQYSQALIVMREMLITFTGELLGLKIFRQYDREQKIAYLHTYLSLYNQPDQLRKKLSALQIEEIQPSLHKVENVLGAELFNNWRHLIQNIQEARNHVGHALMRQGKKTEYIKPSEEIERLKKWIQQSKVVLNEIWNLPSEQRRMIIKSLKKVLKIAKGGKVRCFIIVNVGVHPVVEDLIKQYGEDLRYEVITRGNVELENEVQIARRVKEAVEKNREAEFVLVPSGLPYIITTVYNTILQITSKHPIYLQFNREKGCYEEKILDPRKLIF